MPRYCKWKFAFYQFAGQQLSWSCIGKTKLAPVSFIIDSMMLHKASKDNHTSALKYLCHSFLQVYNAGELLEYCQGFLLQNMVALLTYDDSVKRLLFGKKLHSHDVLSGLLLTLQARIKARNMAPTTRSNTKPK